MGTGDKMVNGVEQCNFARSVAHSSVTSRRPQAIIPSDRLDHPSIARANAAVSIEMPDGTPGYTKKFEDYVSP